MLYKSVVIRSTAGAKKVRLPRLENASGDNYSPVQNFSQFYFYSGSKVKSNLLNIFVIYNQNLTSNLSIQPWF